MMGRWRDGVSLMARSHDREPGLDRRARQRFRLRHRRSAGPAMSARRTHPPRQPARQPAARRPDAADHHEAPPPAAARPQLRDEAGDATAEKGILFVGICADLERQFEFLQQSWVGSPAFNGLANEPDPITSVCPAGAERRLHHSDHLRLAHPGRPEGFRDCPRRRLFLHAEPLGDAVPRQPQRRRASLIAR